MARIKCPQCQSILTLQDVPAGTIVACAQCGTQLRVPAAASSPPAYQDAVEPPPEHAHRQAILVRKLPPPLPLDELEVVDEDEVESPAWPDAALTISPQDAAVLAELEQLQHQRPSWGGTFALLAISLLLYMGAARVDRTWDHLVILIPLLIFHEFGHFVAMRCFGYRNLRMFFIPFFGAAVSGRHYNIAGWKKAVVALAGPVPGIVLGSPLGVLGVLLREPKVVEVAVFLLLLNGFNLLPFLPLDGGWVVHTVLFVRHPVLDVVFRLIAGLGLFGVALYFSAWFLLALAVFMLLAIPLAWRLARIAYRLGQEGLVALSPDAESIPVEAALPILAEVRQALPPQTTPKILAQNVASVFETLNAYPPGPLASLGLLALQGGSFLLALGMIWGLYWLQHPGA